MPDIFSKSKRSEIMSKISSKETKPEILVRKYLFAKGFRYRKNVKELPGKPDVVLPKYKIIIFIHGCFWHGHEGCKKSALPTTNLEFWKDKLEKNKERDKSDILKLQEIGWKVIVIWQCELKNIAFRNNRLEKLVAEITTMINSK
ncbi:MAG: DNA mismatch endonuclease Vsr [Paludibacter sp.]|nr:DNA mismatch endonuclease Vsr [Paludibacter sp.]